MNTYLGVDAAIDAAWEREAAQHEQPEPEEDMDKSMNVKVYLYWSKESEFWCWEVTRDQITLNGSERTQHEARCACMAAVGMVLHNGLEVIGR
jgi:hypothetical protein